MGQQLLPVFLVKALQLMEEVVMVKAVAREREVLVNPAEEAAEDRRVTEVMMVVVEEVMLGEMVVEEVVVEVEGVMVEVEGDVVAVVGAVEGDMVEVTVAVQEDVVADGEDGCMATMTLNPLSMVMVPVLTASAHHVWLQHHPLS